jgi:hypothetical protein
MQVTPTTQPTETKKTIAALRKRLERWELDHLRTLAAGLADQLAAANDRVEALQSELASAWRNAESWQEDAMELVKQLEADGQQAGITQAGQLVVVAQQGGAA